MAEVVVHRRRTGTSLVMMLFALALGAAGYVLTSLNQNGTFPADWLMSAGPLQFGGPWFVGVAAWFALGLLCWGITVWRLPYADPLILPVAFLLTGLGVSMIHRLDQADGKRSAELQMDRGRKPGRVGTDLLDCHAIQDQRHDRGRLASRLCIISSMIWRSRSSSLDACRNILWS